MSQVTYLSEKTAKKKVLYYNDTSGSVTIQGGYAMCYDHAQVDKTQAYRVVRPATLNLLYFAGAVCPEYAGLVVADGKTAQIEIYIPTKYGQVVPLWNDEDLSGAVVVVGISDGSFVFTNAGSPDVARVVQLIARDVTNGTILSRLYGISDPLA